MVGVHRKWDRQHGEQWDAESQLFPRQTTQAGPECEGRCHRISKRLCTVTSRSLEAEALFWLLLVSRPSSQEFRGLTLFIVPSLLQILFFSLPLWTQRKYCFVRMSSSTSILLHDFLCNKASFLSLPVKRLHCSLARNLLLFDIRVSRSIFIQFSQVPVRFSGQFQQTTYYSSTEVNSNNR